MAPFRALSLLLLVAAGCKAPRSTFPPPGASVPVVRFEFRPPEGAPLVERVVSVRTVRRESAQHEERVEVQSVTRFIRSGRGWLLTQQVAGARTWSAGRPVDTPVDEVLAAAPLTLVLAPDGAFVRVEDPEVWERALPGAVPEPALQGKLREFFGADAVEARSRQEWEAKYAGLFHRNLEVGQRLYTLGRQRAGTREVAYVLERTLEGTEATPFGAALVFRLRCLGQVGPEAPLELRAALLGREGVALEPSVACEGEQVVAGNPFVPVRSRLAVSATLGTEGQGGGATEAWSWTQQAAAEAPPPPQEAR